jgi:hypothetical protein
MTNIERLRSRASDPTFQFLTPWIQRVLAAFAAATDIQADYATTFQSKEDVEYHARYMQKVRVVDLILEEEHIDVAGKADTMDEESLPFAIGRFPDDKQMLICLEEVFSSDQRIVDLDDAVCSGFALARDMGYTGPFDLAQHGTEQDKDRFKAEVGAYTTDVKMSARFNAPPEYAA